MLIDAEQWRALDQIDHALKNIYNDIAFTLAAQKGEER